MRKLDDLPINDQWVRSFRGPKNPVDPSRPYSVLLEKERGINGEITEIATVFLTNKECPFKCLMCDLWKNTTDKSVKSGEIPKQIAFALSQLPEAKAVKLYNSGNFFDPNAIPTDDYEAIAGLLSNFNRVIVENHPKLTNDLVFKFQEMLAPRLEIAMGLETSNPQVLARLNKKMTLMDFENAVTVLNEHQIDTRAFILLKPPFMSETEGIFWAQRSIEFAFNAGVKAAVLIPTRFGNGATDNLGQLGHFSPPQITSLEKTLEFGISLGLGDVFADLWDIEMFSSCEKCVNQRSERLSTMNLTQSVPVEIQCSCS